MTIPGAQHLVLVIGAGPAGLFAARKLVENGNRVCLLNRDIKPGGLAEYGIFYNKYAIKNGLRKQFRQILSMPEVEYFGNVTVGSSADVTLDELESLGFKIILVTAGAQGTKSLGLPGERLKGVYHAKDIVYHYNSLPPNSTKEYKVHGKVAVVGVGNVMVDIARWAIRDLKVDEVIAVARRGPAEVKFTKKEMGHIFNNLDIGALDEELARCAPMMQEMNQDVVKARDFILSAKEGAEEKVSDTKFRFEFLSSPSSLIDDGNGNVKGLEVEDTKLVKKGDDTKAVSLGTRRILDVDSVVFCIGDKVDTDFGLPIQWDEFVKDPNPKYPVDGVSYEAYDPLSATPLKGFFVAGWSREASNGLVGLAKKDAESCVDGILQQLSSIPIREDENSPIDKLVELLKGRKKRFITKADVEKLEKAEQEEMTKRNLPDFKFKTNEEMLTVINK